MALLSGSASITRYRIVPVTEEPDFEGHAFRAIQPGSEVRESVGFVPMEPEAPYQVGHGRFAFRVRVDRLSPDPTAVKERVKEMVKTEMELTGAPGVGAKKRRELKSLAEEEQLSVTTPRSKIVEGALDDGVLWVGSTAANVLGTVILLLRHVGVVAEPKAPWIDLKEPEFESEIVEIREPGQSALGCRFLRELLGDRELMIEPEAGHVRLETPETRVTLTGAVLGDLQRYLERGAEVLSAKLLTAEGSFRLDGPSFQVSGLKIETGRHEHWTELLDERLEKIAGTFDLLDRKFAELRGRLRS